MSVILLFLLASFTATAYAASSVTVVQDLNQQLPLVARVNQPYSWTFSPYTFSASDGPLKYTTSTLPAWLLFDDLTHTFHGIPSANDTGYPEITVTAHAASSSTSSRFTICVTNDSPPSLNLPLSQQFNATSKSLSSVFFLRPGSAISTPNPILRVPRKWSFSVGIESTTYIDGDRDVFYELRMANGSNIPDFLNFNSQTVALDGVVPTADKIPQPSLLPFLLYVSDQEGYSSTTVPFDIVVADHELSLETASLPTINITTATPFLVSLLSSADFTGVLVDGGPIQPSNISTLDIDVSGYSWLHYDAPSRTLSGTPGNDTIRTNVSLALVESYFVMPVLPSLHASPGDQIHFNLAQWFSTSTANPGHDSANITASFDPIITANWLRYDDSTANLTGTVPPDYQSTADHVTVTFTAYSRITHSTSHATLAIYIPSTNNTQAIVPTRPSGLDVQAHKRLVLAVVLSFGLIGAMILFVGFFALCRRWARVKDTAVLGEEGRNAWSEKDRRWYGMTLSPGGTRVVERTPTNQSGSEDSLSPLTRPQQAFPNYGLGLRKVSERSHPQGSPGGEVISPGVLSKKEFLARLRETVRKVSGKYEQRQRGLPNRPMIGKPILMASTRAPDQTDSMVHDSASNPFEDTPLGHPGSTFMTGSPSNSTGEHSIPRRRPDFAPPKNMAQVHFDDTSFLVRQVSTGSMGAHSYRSGKSGLSGESFVEVPMGPPTKPRLVPFTSSTRVPVPQATAVVVGAPGGNFPPKRVASQYAKVCKVDSNGVSIEEGVNPSGTSDELTMGIHYVRSLGADQLAVNTSSLGGGSPVLSNIRSSFTSLESSHLGHRSEKGPMKVLVRTGEKFKFRVPIVSTGGKGKGYYVKQISGQPLPKFIHPDLNGIGNKGVLELSGVATFKDIGDVSIGVYAEKDGACVATVVIEVVGKR
ncbi:hypothetical protein NLJ89_g1706 [Agrocybe chaxingu]|uniref:Dystroglycan-type cadherin-like domain-containing protein n=1 Tax=Agrocybe chaxingu TaxID=84603 RepID=A0A9W8MZJ8_9AGAR|nr:hypothetical protein NLJ89_g1706 [Agrocybe chaxingu]